MAYSNTDADAEEVDRRRRRRASKADAAVLSWGRVVVVGSVLTWV